MPNDPRFVRVGPGIVKVAVLGTTAPTTLLAAWDVGFVDLGYTDAGSTWTFENTFEDVNVAEEFDPVLVAQTARSINIAVAAKEMTARNLQIAFNGGTITPSGTPPNEIITYEPPPAGVFTELMIGWQHVDNLERYIFRRCLQVGSVEIARQKAPNAAMIPMTFRVLKPTSGAIFTAIGDANMQSGV
jgi:hypothetical protein